MDPKNITQLKKALSDMNIFAPNEDLVGKNKSVTEIKPTWTEVEPTLTEIKHTFDGGPPAFAPPPPGYSFDCFSKMPPPPDYAPPDAAIEEFDLDPDSVNS